MNNESSLAKALAAEFPELKLSQKKADEMIDFMQRWIVETAAREGSVKLHQYGKFEVKQVAERMGRNPKTGESIKIAARKKISFKPYTLTKEIINQ